MEDRGGARRHDPGVSDLQCPATVILVAPEAVARASLAGRLIAGVFAAADLDDAARAAAGSLAEQAGCRLDEVEGAALREELEALADLHRGETLCVVARPESIAAALRRAGGEAGPVTLAIDSSGWRVSE
jgi:hypothetical protein